VVQHEGLRQSRKTAAMALCELMARDAIAM
jgi:hypothetical protein